jgi:hypothetical protein
MADLFKILVGSLLFSFVASRWVFHGYLSAYKKLQLKHGGRVRNGWVNFPQFVLPQGDGEIIVSAYPTSGSRPGEAHATTYLSNLQDDAFSVVSRKMPNTSFWKIPENWTPAADPNFASKFKSYSKRPELLGLILTQEIRSLLMALNETRPVRVQLDIGGLYKDGRSDIAKQVPYVRVAAYPNSPDFDLAEGLLKLCIAIRNRILDLGTQLPTTPGAPTLPIAIQPLFK